MSEDAETLILDSRNCTQEGGYLLNAARGTLEDKAAQARYYEALIRHVWEEVFGKRPMPDYQDAMHHLKWAARNGLKSA
jgi:phosphoglycerate dehydrogenase-like enzyme